MGITTKQTITRLFDQVAGGYDNPSQRYFPFCGERLISKLKPIPGSKILDVATGTGAVALPAAQAILPGGRVHAVDLSEAMLEKASQNLQRAGLSNVDFHVMDGENLEFQHDYFDYVTCSFGLFFFDDMLAGLKEWHRVLKPGGAIMLTSFSPNAFQPLADIFRKDLQAFGIEIPEMSWQRLKQQDECRALLEQAGFGGIEIETEQMGHHLNGINDWWELIRNTAFRGFIDQLAAAERTRFQVKHQNNISQLADDNGIWLDVETLFTSGRK
ncbi:MAG: class I SAM-dependent methyltransferase [Thioalkalispiraceae bacterium]|jgi:ubiquinone/menaquinone biosynthesis C-methylase UbiE